MSRVFILNAATIVSDQTTRMANCFGRFADDDGLLYVIDSMGGLQILERL